MKKLFLTMAIILTFSTPAFASPASIYVDVNGLVCDFCARALEKVFSKQETVNNINVDLETKVITVNFNDNQSLDSDTITKLITDAGYNVVAIRDEKGSGLKVKTDDNAHKEMKHDHNDGSHNHE